MRSFPGLSLALVAGLLAAGAQGLVLRLDEERISLEADGDRLVTILEEFSRFGVAVKLEPGIDAIVTGSLDDVEINQGLGELLASFNYLLFWRVLDGPVGRITALSGMHIFRPGHQESVIAFEPKDGRLEVVRRRGLPPHARSEILLGLKPGTNMKQFKELLASVGGTVVDSLGGLGIYLVRLPRGADVPRAAAALTRNPWVAVAEPNYVYDLPRAAASSGPETGRTQAAPPPPAGAAALAIFDSGLDGLPLLDDAVTGSYNAVNPGEPMSDTVGHGTQMALIGAGAVAPDGIPLAAVDESVPILAVRSFDDEGRATNYGLLRGIDYTVDHGGRVISMSWGTETSSEFLEYAIGYAQEKGLLVVASAGNQPINRPMYPAAYEGVLGISAVTPDGELWSKSNYGDFIFAAAPGTGTFPVGHNGPPGAYAGTSISSPFIGRALTQYLTQNPGAGNQDAVDALKDALTDSGENGKDEFYGYGTLDAQALERFLGKSGE